ncbi:MAG: ATP-binding cassette domain-containing protein [Deltaproteobacteria bacterium]|nr:ATP-binding cassette domain-containing protein [Deltaproteobacteria bacterium]
MIGVTFAWPGQAPVLLEAGWSLQPGERVFVSGPSGSGKSTLLSLLAGLLVPQKGRIRILGRDLASLSGPQRDRFRGERIGLIFQQFTLLPYLSVLENVMLPARLSPWRGKRAREDDGSAEKGAGRLLAGLSLDRQLWSRPVRKLSVGQQQRAAAARALLGRPPLILADEPTSALDADQREIFADLLLQEAQKAGSSVLFVSHETSLAGRFDRSLPLSALAGGGEEPGGRP